MLFVPITCDLLVVLVESGVVLAILIVPVLPAILCQNPISSKGKKCCHTNNYPQTCLHKHLQISSKCVHVSEHRLAHGIGLYSFGHKPGISVLEPRGSKNWRVGSNAQ